MVILPTFNDLITDAPSFSTRIPRQRDLTRLVVASTIPLSIESLSQPARIHALHMAKQTFKSFDESSPLIHAFHFNKKHTLSHSPTQFLATTHSLNTPFSKTQFSVFAGYALDTPTMPTCLQPRKDNGDYFPCRCSGELLPTADGHHKMVCRNSGWSGAHDHLEDEIVAAVRPAHLQCTASKSIVPKHADSKHQGDILVTLSPASSPFVLDISVPHPYSGLGEYKPNAVQEAYAGKVIKHRQAYESQGYSFLPAIGSTYGRQHPDLVRLQFIVANAQAEYIVKYLQPHKDFKTLAGYCFAGIKGHIGAAFARALAYRALSCTKDGRRRHYNAYGPRIQAANQHLNLPVAPISYAAVGNPSA